MAHSIHLKVVRQGAGDIQAFRALHQNIQLDLREADLSNVELSNADLSNADLSNADLRNANLRGANLTAANLTQAALSNANMAKATMATATLDDANLSGANLTGANLANSSLLHTNLRNAIPFNSAADCVNAIISEVRPEDFPVLREANLKGLDLSNLNLQGIDLQNAKLIDTNLSGTDFHRANFTNAILTNANLSHANMIEASLQHTNLRNADLSSGRLVLTDLSRADISGAKLLGAKIDSTTNLNDIKCYKSTVDCSTAEYMRASGATLGQMMDLNIVDDLATLRAEFGGLWGAIHLTSVIVFLLPYAWFLGQQVLASRARGNAESMIYSMESWANRQADHITFVSAEAFKTAVESKIEQSAKEWREQLSLVKSPAFISTFAESAICTADTWANRQADHITFLSAEALKTAVESKIEQSAKEWRKQLKLKSPKEISILDALSRYIWNGGKGWRQGYDFNRRSFVPFLFVAFYNVLRLTLLYKTKKLATLESVRKLPVVFSLGNGWKSWRTVYQMNRIGFWVALVLILMNTAYFLGSTIQI